MTWTLVGSTAISGTYRGLDEIDRQFNYKCWDGDGREGSATQGLDPDYGIKPLEIGEVTALEDGRVLAHCWSDGRGRNGISYKNEYLWLFTVKNGRLVSVYEFADTALIEVAIFSKKIVPAEDVAAEKG